MKQSQKVIQAASIAVPALVLLSTPAHAMHIAEGFLPLGWSIAWSVLLIPFLAFGLLSIKKQVAASPRAKLLLAMSGAYCFGLSALKMPSVTGSSSHPTGTGLGAVLFGPAAMVVLGVIVLLFQALLLAHGGFTTLGANACSMAVAGPFVGFGVYWLARKLKAPNWLSVFLCAFTADLFTYIVTSFQLALAFGSNGFGEALAKFMGIFALTQLPLAIIEGVLTVMIYQALVSLCGDEIKRTPVRV